MYKQIEIFTDGACLRNPGPGGFAAILRYRQQERVVTAGYRLTTNNRMELLAAIVALEHLKESCQVTLTTDSQYVRQGITRWIHQWKRQNWQRTNRKPVLNCDLWQRLDPLCQGHQLQWHWVRGHNGHPENTRCDTLAKQAAEQPTLEDIGYTQTQ